LLDLLLVGLQLVQLHPVGAAREQLAFPVLVKDNVAGYPVLPREGTLAARILTDEIIYNLV